MAAVRDIAAIGGVNLTGSNGSYSSESARHRFGCTRPIAGIAERQVRGRSVRRALRSRRDHAAVLVGIGIFIRPPGSGLSWTPAIGQNRRQSPILRRGAGCAIWPL
jgi:hypothetical protein